MLYMRADVIRGEEQVGNNKLRYVEGGGGAQHPKVTQRVRTRGGSMPVSRGRAVFEHCVLQNQSPTSEEHNIMQDDTRYFGFNRRTRARRHKFLLSQQKNTCKDDTR